MHCHLIENFSSLDKFMQLCPIFFRQFFTYRVSFDVSLRLRLVAFVVNHSFRTVVLFDCNKGALLFSQLINQLHDCCQKCCRGVTLGLGDFLSSCVN